MGVISRIVKAVGRAADAADAAVNVVADHVYDPIAERARELSRLGLTLKEWRESQERPGEERDPEARRQNVRSSLLSGAYPDYYRRIDRDPRER